MACRRCKGLMVEEWHFDLMLEHSFWRCVNCGAVVDPTIQSQPELRLSLQVVGSKQQRAARPVGSSSR
jgi:hypothetical protein